MDEKPHVSDDARRAILTLRITVAVLVLAIGFLVARQLGEQSRTNNRIENATDGNCKFWHDIAVLPLTAQSQPTALTIVADARYAYEHQGCAARHGILPSPDPRISGHLPR